MEQQFSVIAIVLMIFWAITASMTSSMMLDFGGNSKNLECSFKFLLNRSRT